MTDGPGERSARGAAGRRQGPRRARAIAVPPRYAHKLEYRMFERKERSGRHNSALPASPAPRTALGAANDMVRSPDN